MEVIFNDNHFAYLYQNLTCSKLSLLPVNTVGYVIVKTNTAGKVAWETSASFGSKTTIIYVEAYW